MMDERLEISPMPAKPLDDRGWELLNQAATAYVALEGLTNSFNAKDGEAPPGELRSLQFDRGTEYGRLYLLLELLAAEYPYDLEDTPGVNQNHWHRAIQDSPSLEGLRSAWHEAQDRRLQPVADPEG